MADDLLEIDDDCEECINISDAPAKFQLDNHTVTLKPKQKVRVPKAYTTKRVFKEGNDPMPSVIELETGKRVLPVSDPRAKGAVATAAAMAKAK